MIPFFVPFWFDLLCFSFFLSSFKLSIIIHSPHRFFMPAIPAILHQQQNIKDMSQPGKQQEERKDEKEENGKEEMKKKK